MEGQVEGPQPDLGPRRTQKHSAVVDEEAVRGCFALNACPKQAHLQSCIGRSHALCKDCARAKAAFRIALFGASI